MSGYWIFYDGGGIGADIVNTPSEAIDVIVRRARRLNINGQFVFTYWIGPVTDGWTESHLSRGTATMRIDVDYDRERAAMTWLPDGTHVAEVDPPTDGPLLTHDPLVEDGSGDIEVDSSLATTTVGAAIYALAQHVDTGTKPTGVTWA
ncbi:hypothetical protein Lfu02_78760 [Longispora fulva]|uniref:Uncharacterized protein n=1 Tax=Longispora fulva TaxID=619741 RepID=A0A8J7KUE8_9ACTN|nr:hypothetical protein [Longispora fulva]MBG6133967.1 hypothetical protein [Longispora fulva]GIG63504.1 hypothetical protein Lfu02_78760 [Longispora fulva]